VKPWSLHPWSRLAANLGETYTTPCYGMEKAHSLRRMLRLWCKRNRPDLQGRSRRDGDTIMLWCEPSTNRGPGRPND